MRTGGLRPLLVALLLSAIVFAAGFGGGFVYAHDPRPDEVIVRVERPAAALDEEQMGGSIVGLGQGRIEVRAGDETLTFELPPGTPVEEMVPVGQTAFAVGAPVNIGGTVTARGQVLTGVVTFDTTTGAAEAAEAEEAAQ